MKTDLPQRPTPMWPTYLARLAALATFIGGPFAAKGHGYLIEVAEEWGLAFGISGCLALLVGNLVMHCFEWLVNAHRDSVETRSRFNFGIMMLTAGVFAVSLATFVVQWQKA
ncbi:hypothetical protein [Agrobacterium vitis]|uniref:hypothetical protein n=1 Tax=Agrobacterium vitis TaxID=373 RepID=UPI00115FA3A0|nr:hypothetical protein [Agrobacterium vitis]MUO87160.1 hypothetical protein [Agrobacterium vitis]